MRTFFRLNIRLFANSLCLLIFVLFAAACKDNSEKQPDVAAVKIRLNSQRLDRDMIKMDTNHLADGLVMLQKQYPNFLNFYLDTLIGLGLNGHFSDSSRAVNEGLRSYLTFPDYKNLYDTVFAHYPSTDKIDAELAKGFQYLKHYYPAYQTPQIIYFVGYLANWGVVSYDGIIGIGLDMFLGEQYPYYASVGQPAYMYINFRPQSIAPSVFSTLYNDIHPFEDEEKTLLEMMIQKGKQQYFVEKMLPWISLEDRIGYTAEQLKWAADNEAMIYNFFLDNNLMFEKNWSKMRRFVVYGPNTSGMPPESPGNIGTWLGLQMVKAYARENPGLTPEQIFADTNAEQFLKKAKYKPQNTKK